jgi:hypothetical protein
VNSRVLFTSLFAFLLATRLPHSGVLWAEEGLPLAAAIQALHGKMLYRDIWFDKPPLTTLTYVLWEARTDWLLRVAGAVWILLCCWLVYRVAREIWGEREGRYAALFLGFFLTFGIASAVIPLAADLFMVAPHLAAVHAAWQRRALLSGLFAGVALLFNAKAVFVIAFCGLLLYRYPIRFALGVALPTGAMLAWLHANGAADAYLLQVWQLGSLYAQHTFVQDPLWAGFLRTLNWVGFHAAIVALAIVFLWRDQGPRRRFIIWIALSVVAVAAGWRFFPRYYFQLLPVICIAASRGAVLAGSRVILALALLVIPLARFGPRYAILAYQTVAGKQHTWRDLAMDADSRAASALLQEKAKPGDTLFVWGYRPDMYAYTRMRAASRFLESQPLTGVLADRHLTQTSGLPVDWTADHRRELARSTPTFVVDGLAAYNATLSLTAFEDLRDWLANYEPTGQTQFTTIYQRRSPP